MARTGGCSPRIPSLGCRLSLGADAVRIEEIALACCHEPDKGPSSIGNGDVVVEKCTDAAKQKKTAAGLRRPPSVHLPDGIAPRVSLVVTASPSRTSAMPRADPRSLDARRRCPHTRRASLRPTSASFAVPAPLSTRHAFALRKPVLLPSPALGYRSAWRSHAEVRNVAASGPQEKRPRSHNSLMRQVYSDDCAALQHALRPCLPRYLRHEYDFTCRTAIKRST